MNRTFQWKRLVILISVIFSIGFCRGINSDDFETAKKAFERKDYKIAELYFCNLLKEAPCSEYTPDAVYYLVKIYEKSGNFLKLFNLADDFLRDYKYDRRCNEVFNILLKKLNEKGAYNIAIDYIKNYDYLVNDFAVLEEIGYGLFKEKRYILAEYLFSLCPQTDTIRILRAKCISDFKGKKELYSKISGVKGSIYLMELLLESGDTLTAYEIYRTTRREAIDDDLLYPYTKISMLFDSERFLDAVKRLKRIKEFKNRAILLEALYSGELSKCVVPQSMEECSLLTEFFNQDTTLRIPDSISIDTLFQEPLIEEKILMLKEEIGGYYALDSILAGILLKEGRIEEAFKVIIPYLEYKNAVAYCRTVRARKYYQDGDYESAANDIILSQTKEPELLLMLADALTVLGENPLFLYDDISATAEDTLIIAKVRKNLMVWNFMHGDYDEVVKQGMEFARDDTSLIRLYLYSLARTGKKATADSLFCQFFNAVDYRLLNYYGEFLIEQKRYSTARVYYDSIIDSLQETAAAELYFNWALVPFLEGEIDTAYERFISFMSQFKDDEKYYRAAFKIATIKYLKQEFDSAVYYYKIAAEDDSLCLDALQNQLICYKKAGDWKKVIESGNELIPFLTEEEEAGDYFEIGYAYLRSGKLRNAIDYLKRAAELDPSPEFHYWLGEAYLAKGDFIRSLYQYQKIIELYPRDEMWTPTAHYKKGIVLEFMDEVDEAKKVYRAIIKKRGRDDTWGIEAQKRLEALE